MIRLRIALALLIGALALALPTADAQAAFIPPSFQDSGSSGGPHVVLPGFKCVGYSDGDYSYKNFCDDEDVDAVSYATSGQRCGVSDPNGVTNDEFAFSVRNGQPYLGNQRLVFIKFDDEGGQSELVQTRPGPLPVKRCLALTHPLSDGNGGLYVILGVLGCGGLFLLGAVWVSGRPARRHRA